MMTLEEIRNISKDYPTPFYIYDEAGIKKTIKNLKEALPTK